MAVLNQDIYIGGSAGDVFNLNAWKDVPVVNGSISVTGTSVVISADGASEAYTATGALYPDEAVIYVHAGEKVKASWTAQYSEGEFIIYPNGGTGVSTSSEDGELEYEVASGVSYVLIGISTPANGTTSFSNIKIEVEALFHFTKDEISDPESIQSVDLIEEKLPIDTFTPIVYYETRSRENLFNFDEWAYSAVINGTKTVGINKFTLSATADNCYTAFAEEEYPPEARIPISEGETIILTWSATGALGYVRLCPGGSSLTAISAVSATGELSYTGVSGVTYVTISFSVASANQSITFSDIVIRREIAPPDEIRELPFGMPIRYYIQDELVHKFYIRSVERVGRNAFKLDCVSAVGILDKIYHPGGVYLGTTFGAIVEEMIGGILSYTINTDVANTKIFGYLPYTKARENLHQLMFACNVTILKNAEGDMHFAFLNNAEVSSSIDPNRIYISGSVEYPTIATEVRLTEHSFQYDDTLDYVTLIDNTNSRPVDHKVYVFDNAPIAVESLLASETLTVHYAHPNYAIVSGTGILQGIPYYDRTSVISKTHATSGEDYVVSSNDVTVVTPLNSENVADRLMSYYSSAKIVKGDIKLSSEKTGNRYSFLDAFNESVVGYLRKIVSYSSSFVKAACEFVTGYISNKFGNNYSYHAVVTGPGILQVPEGTKLMRLTLVGGGDGGQSGLAASEPDKFSTAGGIGGQGGESGNGGYIKEVILVNPTAGEYTVTIGTGGAGTLECTSTETHLEGGTGGHTTITTPGGVTYSTADNDAYRCESGVMDLFTGIVYGRKGREGIKGGNGGRGGSTGDGEAGESITYRGVVRKGGVGGTAVTYKLPHLSESLACGGGGGSGAQAYADGIDGGESFGNFWDLTDDPHYSGQYKAWLEGQLFSGLPGFDTPKYDSTRVYQPGDGGDAGHGGAGRGGWGECQECEIYGTDPDTSKSIRAIYYKEETHDYRTAYSSKGLKGDPGQSGCIIVYSDKQVSYGESVLDTPTITNTSTAQQASFSFTNVGNNVSYQIERKMIWSYVTNMPNYIEGFVVIDEQTYTTYGQTYEYVDSTAESTASYEYRIKAVGHGSAVDSDYSNVIVGGYGASQLTAPVLTGETTYYGVEYEWDKPTGADMYLVASKEHSSDEWIYVWWQSSSLDHLSAIHEMTGGVTWDYKVCAGSYPDLHVASQWSNVVTLTAPQQAKVYKPEIYTSSNSNSFVQGGVWNVIRWSVPRNADYLVIERKKPADASWTQIGVQQSEIYDAQSNTTSRRYQYDDIISGTVHGDVWQYRVKAFKDGWIDSDYSNILECTINLKLLPVTNVTVEQIDPANPPSGYNPITDITSDENCVVVRWQNVDPRTSRLWVAFYKNNDPSTNRGAYVSYNGYQNQSVSIHGSWIMEGGPLLFRVFACGSSDNPSDLGVTDYIYSDGAPTEGATITLPIRTYFYSSASTSTNKDDSGLTGGWKNGRDSNSGTLSYGTDANGNMTMSAGASTSGYRITSNPINLTGYNKLCMIGTLTKPSRDAQSRFGTCKYTGDSSGVGCWSLNYASLGTYASGTMTNPSLTSFTKTNDTHIMLFMSQSGSAKVTRIFATKS